MDRKKGVRKIGSGLAGALAIASGTSAYGTIIQVFPPLDLTNTAGAPETFRTWDVNGDGIFDFRFVNRFPNTPPQDSGVLWQLRMDPFGGTASTNGLLSYAGPNVRYAFALAPYTVIGASRPGFSTQTQVVLGSKYHYNSANPYYYGGFAAGRGDLGMGGYQSVFPGTFAFVGFRFQAADGTHYGWIKLSVNGGIIDFHTAAYESSPNGSIVTANLDPLVPEPGTMALLAIGAVGIVGAVTKRRRS